MERSNASHFLTDGSVNRIKMSTAHNISAAWSDCDLVNKLSPTLLPLVRQESSETTVRSRLSSFCPHSSSITSRATLTHVLESQNRSARPVHDNINWTCTHTEIYTQLTYTLISSGLHCNKETLHALATVSSEYNCAHKRYESLVTKSSIVRKC